MPHDVTEAPLRLLRVGSALNAASLGPAYDVIEAVDLAAATLQLAALAPFDAVVLDGDAIAPDSPAAADIAAIAALVVVLRDADSPAADAWLTAGADDVISADEAASPSTPRRLRHAVLRRRRDAARVAPYATDPGTGLPHRQQLVEHLSQLLALREREPAPMAIVVLRLDGLATQPGRPLAETQALRRKLAVRLRAGVRASDIVATLDGDGYAVLLGSLLAPGDAERVAAKLAAALLAPVQVGGIECEVTVSLGIARYPQDGNDAERLLRRAAALAAAAPAAGRAGPAAARGAEGQPRIAANDDGA